MQSIEEIVVKIREVNKDNLYVILDWADCEELIHSRDKEIIEMCKAAIQAEVGCHDDCDWECGNDMSAALDSLLHRLK